MNHATPPDLTGFVCPAPLRDRPQVVMGHGGGGALSRDLLEHVFLPAFGNAVLDRLGDSSVLDLGPRLAGGSRLAFSTDSYVVRPLVFPGGSIGELAVNGTVNDLAMSGAEPLFLSAAFILEEGLAIAELAGIVARMAAAAAAAGVTIVTGDTKVVERGRGDGLTITTAGIGVVPPGLDLGPQRIRPGDAVIVSGTLADHGMAIMSVREGLGFEAAIESDTAPLHGLVAALVAACPGLRMLRDPTRGGVAASLNEIAAAAAVGIEIDEHAIPVTPVVASACEILGLDPLQVANEGKLLAVVPADSAATALAVLGAHEQGRHAARLGRIVAGHPGIVAVRTALGGTRVVPLPIGEQLPRIC
ncbi:MAG: hydrogenase expression/formation protein HypE [Planctomycetota bacterium]